MPQTLYHKFCAKPYCPSTHAFSRITTHTKAIAIANVMKKLSMYIMVVAPRYLYPFGFPIY
jgi:hypothetical protein